MIYFLLRALLRHALQIYFREVEIEGREDVPAEGPLLLAANHPNTLIDVLLVGTCLDRRVGFVAKSTLFRGLAKPLLHFFGAVPVSRRIDGEVDEETRKKNEQVLAACEDAVARGGAILIFPEGVSQDAPRLLELRTGLARIALGAERRAPGRVAIVPVALAYDDGDTFRSRARVRFAPPIAVAPYRALADGSPADGHAAAGPGDRPADERAAAEKGAVRALTETVRAALEPEVVHVDAADLDPLLAGLIEVYGPKVEAEAGGRLAAAVGIARAVNAFARTDPARVARVRGLLDDYRAALARAGVTDRAVRSASIRRARPGEQLAFWLSAPLALWGIAQHLLFYQLPRLAVRALTQDHLYASTIKLLFGLLALTACYAVQTWGVRELAGGPAAAAYLGTLPLSGLVALLWLEGLEARGRARRARAERARLEPAVRADLEARRAALVGEVDRARAAWTLEQTEQDRSPAEA